MEKLEAYREAMKEIGDMCITISPNMKVKDLDVAGTVANAWGFCMVIDNGKPSMRWEL